jgi:endonuclease-3
MINRKEARRVFEIIRLLEQEYGEAECALHHEDAYQLLVATILSAQCTDARVNMVTPALFRRFPDPHALAQAELDELQEIIRSTGFFRNKARSLQGSGRRLVDEFDGEVPSNMPDLLKLPGVARKTANVVLGTAYGIASGVVVDTHVGRLSRRLGLTHQKTPVKVEKDLMGMIPREEWINFAHRLIHHGRRVCQSRRPRCGECAFADLCPRVGVLT